MNFSFDDEESDKSKSQIQDTDTILDNGKLEEGSQDYNIFPVSDNILQNQKIDNQHNDENSGKSVSQNQQMNDSNIMKEELSQSNLQNQVRPQYFDPQKEQLFVQMQIEVEALKKNLENRDEENSSLKSKLAEKDKEVNDLRKQLKEKNEQLQQKQEEISKKEDEERLKEQSKNQVQQWLMAQQRWKDNLSQQPSQQIVNYIQLSQRVNKHWQFTSQSLISLNVIQNIFFKAKLQVTSKRDQLINPNKMNRSQVSESEYNQFKQQLTIVYGQQRDFYFYPQTIQEIISGSEGEFRNNYQKSIEIQQLLKEENITYAGKVRGDGNCFFRSFWVLYFKLKISQNQHNKNQLQMFFTELLKVKIYEPKKFEEYFPNYAGEQLVAFSKKALEESFQRIQNSANPLKQLMSEFNVEIFDFSLQMLIKSLLLEVFNMSPEIVKILQGDTNLSDEILNLNLEAGSESINLLIQELTNCQLCLLNCSKSNIMRWDKIEYPQEFYVEDLKQFFLSDIQPNDKQRQPNKIYLWLNTGHYYYLISEGQMKTIQNAFYEQNDCSNMMENEEEKIVLNQDEYNKNSNYNNYQNNYFQQSNSNQLLSIQQQPSQGQNNSGQNNQNGVIPQQNQNSMNQFGSYSNQQFSAQQFGPNQGYSNQGSQGNFNSNSDQNQNQNNYSPNNYQNSQVQQQYNQNQMNQQENNQLQIQQQQQQQQLQNQNFQNQAQQNTHNPELENQNQQWSVYNQQYQNLQNQIPNQMNQFGINQNQQFQAGQQYLYLVNQVQTNNNPINQNNNFQQNYNQNYNFQQNQDQQTKSNNSQASSKNNSQKVQFNFQYGPNSYLKQNQIQLQDRDSVQPTQNQFQARDSYQPTQNQLQKRDYVQLINGVNQQGGNNNLGQNFVSGQYFQNQMNNQKNQQQQFQNPYPQFQSQFYQQNGNPQN